ncbi:MAG: sensor histidine kinase [Anaerolineae bacterium]
MNLSLATLKVAPHPALFSGPHLRRYWSWLVRTTWLLYLIFVVGLYIVGLPLIYSQRLQPCDGPNCAPWQVTTVDAQALHDSGLSLSFYAIYASIMPLLIPIAGLIAASLVAWYRAAHDRIALLTVLIVGTCAGLLPDIVQALSRAYPALAWPIQALNFVHIAGMLPWTSLFPDGRWVPRWGRWLALPSFGVGLLLFFPATNVSLVILKLWWPLMITLSLGLLYYRYRWHANLAQKQQIRWVLVGTVIAVLMQVSLFILTLLWPALSRPGSLVNLVADTMIVVSVAFLMCCFGFAVLRQRLFDSDLILNRTLVYGALTAIIAGVYGLVVGFLSALLHTPGSFVGSLIATAIIAVAFSPLRDQLQRGVNRLMYGHRDDPYQVISRLGQRLEASFEPWAALPTIVETTATALKLPYVAIALSDRRQQTVDGGQNTAVPPGYYISGQRSAVVAEYGAPVSSLTRLPLAYAGETIGELWLAPRACGKEFSAADRRLLSDLARQAGVAAHAFLLATDLERARLRMVTAREEARRQLGNDLHDGVGHRLAGLLRHTEAVISLVERNPLAARDQLDEIRQQTKAAIEAVRGLAHTLHPPELELLGLVGALRERIAQMREPGGLQVQLEAPPHLPGLPIATEVAAYYIALEALANVQRHARARCCCLRLGLAANVTKVAPLPPFGEPILEIEVKDDGQGLAPTWQHGLGLTSMRERAVEVGGLCTVKALPGGGTRVLARLPCLLEVGDPNTIFTDSVLIE